jgi:hypothetical protein
MKASRVAGPIVREDVALQPAAWFPAAGGGATLHETGVTETSENLAASQRQNVGSPFCRVTPAFGREDIARQQEEKYRGVDSASLVYHPPFFVIWARSLLTHTCLALLV